MPENITATSVVLMFDPPKTARGIEHYLGMTTKGSEGLECEVGATSDPLMCGLRGLKPATQHTVAGYACGSESTGCGDDVLRTFWTPPSGKLK